eukprot:PRCOL_00005948-RA
MLRLALERGAEAEDTAQVIRAAAAVSRRSIERLRQIRAALAEQIKSEEEQLSALEYALSKCEADAALTRTIDTLRERQGRAAEW